MPGPLLGSVAQCQANCHCHHCQGFQLLIAADTIVTFVNLTNQNPGFTINVQFLDKVSGACQQDQSS